MTDPTGFTKLVPGFDFLQTLVKNAGAAMPGIGQWVAPTIDPDELAKRIEELRTVQFWLEQNARMLGATIQAMEVQRMTLSTLKTMNVQMEDLRDSLKITIPGMGAPSPSSSKPPAPAPAADAAPPTDAPAARPAPVDPMQWWGALTRQFTELATNAMKDSAGDAARVGAGAGASAGASAGTSAPTAAQAAAPAADTEPATDDDAAARPDARPRSPRAPAARKTTAPR